MARATLLGVVASASLVATFAEGAPAGRARLQTLVALDGTCKKLSLPGYDFTAGCDPRLANEVFDNGRTGFTFTLKTGSTVSFSGAGRQVKQGPDAAIQPIDTMIWSMGSGVPPIPEAVVGRCRFTNPYKGKATVSCTATSAKGEYAGEFLTDGTPPTERNF